MNRQCEALGALKMCPNSVCPSGERDRSNFFIGWLLSLIYDVMHNLTGYAIRRSTVFSSTTNAFVKFVLRKSFLVFLATECFELADGMLDGFVAGCGVRDVDCATGGNSETNHLSSGVPGFRWTTMDAQEIPTSKTRYAGETFCL